MNYTFSARILIIAWAMLFASVWHINAQTGQEEETPPVGYKDAVKIVPGSDSYRLMAGNQIHIMPKLVVYNGEEYGCLDYRHIVYQIRRTLTKIRSVHVLGTRKEEFRFIHQFDYQNGYFLTVTPQNLHFFSTEEQQIQPNNNNLISAVLDGEDILAINRNEQFNDMENLVLKLDRDGTVLKRWKKDIGIPARLRNTAMTYRLKRRGDGGVAVYSRFTGEIVPDLEAPITANILNDPYAKQRASHNIKKLEAYLENMSGTADYVNVIDDVVSDGTNTYALCYTGDKIFIKRVPKNNETTNTYFILIQDPRIAGAHLYNDVLYILKPISSRREQGVLRFRIHTRELQ